MARVGRCPCDSANTVKMFHAIRPTSRCDLPDGYAISFGFERFCALSRCDGSKTAQRPTESGSAETDPELRQIPDLSK